MFYVYAKFQIGNSIKQNLQFLCKIDKKVSIFVEELKKMQPPKITFRSQIGPLIKSYECFMFLLNFRLEITWTDGFLKDLNRVFLSILPPLLKTHTPHTPRF